MTVVRLPIGGSPQYFGLSGDAKPASILGARFLETDTGDLFVYTGVGTGWIKPDYLNPPSAGGGGSADFGTKITAATIPTGGVGNLGWLSAIWKAITDGIGVATINAVAPAFDSGVRGPTVLRVTLATNDQLAIVGNLAHDAVASGNPVRVSSRAGSVIPTPVNADLDVVESWADRHGAQMVRPRPALSQFATPVAQNTASVQVIAANDFRLGARIYNNSTSNMRVKEGTAASSTSFTDLVPPGSSWRMDVQEGVYVGAIHCIWEGSGSGTAIPMERYTQ